jgi:anti-sigma factor RsiW
MECKDARAMLDGYVDGELGLETSVAIQEHLAACADCTTIVNNRKMLQRAMKSDPLYYCMPVGLEQKILSSIQSRKDGSQSQSKRTWPSQGPDLSAIIRRRVTYGAAAVLIIFSVISVVHDVVSQPSTPSPVPATAPDVLTQAIFASDERALMAVDQGIDVKSSDQHTVKPWFAGKLDFSPKVQDFTAQGFPLLGGRRDYINGRTVAALVYRRRVHLINVYIWPSQDEERMYEDDYQGYHMYHWASSGMTYWAVSDLNLSELHQFVAMVQAEQ